MVLFFGFLGLMWAGALANIRDEDDDIGTAVDNVILMTPIILIVLILFVFSVLLK